MYRVLKKTLDILSEKEKYRLFLLTLSTILISVLDILFLAGSLFLLKFYTHPQPVISIGRLFSWNLNGHLLYPILLFFIAFSFKNLVGYYVTKSEFNFVYLVASRISKNMLRQFLENSYTAYVEIDSSVINRQISQQPIEFSHYVLNGFQQIFSQLVLILLTLLGIAIYNPALIPLLLLMIVLPVSLIGITLRRKLKNQFTQSKHASEKSIQYLQEALSGYVESNIWGKNYFFTERYDRYQTKLNKHLAERLSIQSLPGRLIEIFSILTFLLLIFLNYAFSGQFQISVITIGALMLSAYKIIPGIVRVVNLQNQIKSYAYSIENLDLQKGRSEYSSAGLKIESMEFKKVEFRYPEKEVLSGFCGFVKNGEMIGISANSGKGKTSLVNILVGFLEQQSGEVFINGKVADLPERKKYWQRISYVKQTPFFIHSTIAENIALQEKDFDIKRLEEVIQIVGLNDFISACDGGINSIITENGKNLSGGQRQRFALARALYRDYDLLILDESLSELDASSENKILRNLQGLSESGKMILLITHNQHSLEKCSRKYVLDEN